MTETIGDVIKDHPVDFLTGVLLPGLRGEAGDAIAEALRGYVTGEDGAQLRDFGISIAGDFARAMARGRQDLVEDLEHQLLLVAELHRIKLNKHANAVVLRILTVVGQIAFKLAQEAIQVAVTGAIQGLTNGLTGGGK